MVDSADDGRVTTTWEYWYDAFNRLEWVCQDGQPVRRYRFDQSDNRSELQFFENGVLKETHAYRYELGDRLTRVSLGPSALFHFEYDDDGNTVLREEVGKRTDVYTWTDAGALKSIRTSIPGQPDAVMRNEYDAGRIRKRKLAGDLTQTDYYYSGLPALSETLSPLEGEPSKRSYVVGHQVLGYFEGDSFRLFLPDALGSVRDLVGSTGIVHARSTYDEYGQLVVVERDYNGQFGGGLGVQRESVVSAYYMLMRWYSPDLGRFLSRDPVGISKGGLNHYVYAANSPLNFVDPMGLSIIRILIEGAVGAYKAFRGGRKGVKAINRSGGGNFWLKGGTYGARKAEAKKLAEESFGKDNILFHSAKDHPRSPFAPAGSTGDHFQPLDRSRVPKTPCRWSKGHIYISAAGVVSLDAVADPWGAPFEVPFASLGEDIGGLPGFVVDLFNPAGDAQMAADLYYEHPAMMEDFFNWYYTPPSNLGDTTPRG